MRPSFLGLLALVAGAILTTVSAQSPAVDALVADAAA